MRARVRTALKPFRDPRRAVALLLSSYLLMSLLFGILLAHEFPQDGKPFAVAAFEITSNLATIGALIGLIYVFALDRGSG